MMTYAKPIRCPQCGRFDQVRKVSALYHAGASTSVITGSGVGFLSDLGDTNSMLVGELHLTGGQQTLLSQRLSPPAKPEFKARASEPVYAVVLFILAGVFFLASLGNNQPYDLCSLLLVTLIFTTLGVVAVVRLRRTEARNEAGRKQWQVEYERWQTSIATWEAMYYCGRDDLVFVPGTPMTAPASAMWTLL